MGEWDEQLEHDLFGGILHAVTFEAAMLLLSGEIPPLLSDFIWVFQKENTCKPGKLVAVLRIRSSFVTVLGQCGCVYGNCSLPY